MKMSDPDLLVTEVQTFEARGVHPSLDAGQIIGVLRQKLTAAAEGLQDEVVSGHVVLMLRSGQFRIG